MGMSYALKAADELAKDGIDAEVIDLRTLKPMDTETIIASVQKTGRACDCRGGLAAKSGVGAESRARVMEHAFDYLDAPVARVSGKDVPMPYAANLEKLGAAVGRRSRRGGQGRSAIGRPARCPPTSSCRRCRPRWKRAICQAGSRRKATRSSRATSLREIETDKATMEYEAVDDGTLAKIVVPEGTQDVAVEFAHCRARRRRRGRRCKCGGECHRAKAPSCAARDQNA